MKQLQAQLKSAEQRAKAADARALSSQQRHQERQSLQANAALSLPTEWTAAWQPLDPGSNTSLPRHESLQFQQRPESPVSAMQQAKSSSSPNNPVHIFRQVYRDRADKQQAVPEERSEAGT